MCSEELILLNSRDEYPAQCFVYIKRKCNILIFTWEYCICQAWRFSITRCVNSWATQKRIESRRRRWKIPTVTRFIVRTREHEGETRREGVTRSSRRDERGEDFLKLHFVAPERPYTGISTPTARDNEASTGVPFMEVRDTHRWVHRRNVRPTGT